MIDKGVDQAIEEFKAERGIRVDYNTWQEALELAREEARSKSDAKTLALEYFREVYEPGTRMMY